MPVIRAADAAVHDLHDARFHSYASSATGSAELCVWRLDVARPTTSRPHRISHEEVFVVAEGTLLFAADDEEHTLSAGDVAVAPAGCLLRLDNLGPGPAAVWVSTRSGLEAELADGSRISPPWAR
jgi:quercetin dioxygenase-like cupin family protein